MYGYLIEFKKAAALIEYQGNELKIFPLFFSLGFLFFNVPSEYLRK